MSVFTWSLVAGAFAYLAERVTHDIEEAVEDLEEAPAEAEAEAEEDEDDGLR